MSQPINIDNENQAVLLYNNSQKEWKEKTVSVSAIYLATYYGNSSGYHIYFSGSDTKFFYKRENVRFLSKVRQIDISGYDVMVEDQPVSAISVDEFEQKYYRIKTPIRTFFTQAMKLESNKHRSIMEYFQQLAAYASTVAEPNSPLYFLAQNYLRIDYHADNDVLKTFLKGLNQSVVLKHRLLLPFDFNQSQANAIESALTHRISVIEGPPGTGKTQTILNLIANILYAGKNCAVISNNNTAIENVYEKLQEEHLAFLAASLGNKGNVVQFFENDQQAQLSEFMNVEPVPLTDKEQKLIDQLSRTIKRIQETEVETAILEAQLTELQNEERHFEQLTDDVTAINPHLSSGEYLSFIIRLQEPSTLSFIKRWFIAYKLKQRSLKVDVNTLIRSVEKQFYISRVSELTQQIDDNKQYLNKQDKQQTLKDLQALYNRALQSHIRTHYNSQPIHTFTADNYKYRYNEFLHRYPVILSTSQSLLNNAPRGFNFDYLIIDEASQGDLLSSTLAMSCARNLVVVGDSCQLQQIDEAILFDESDKLAEALQIPEAYRYSSNSILKSVKEAIPDVPTTLLKEHYRCAPDIINFCNKMFYNGQLVAMTHNTGNHLQIIRTVAGNHARSNPHGSGLYNQREIDEIGELLKTNDTKSIGIITPFRYQADLLTHRFGSENIEADTIHKFQGRQKEEVILSFVVNALDENMDKNRLYDFVTNDKLLNVAISRGQKKVTAIVSDKVFHSKNNIIHDFIKYTEYLYGTETIRESTVTSVFDLLYSEHTDLILSKYRNRPNEHKSELLMCDLINELLVDYYYIGYCMHTRLGSFIQIPAHYSEEEKRYITHPWTHVDFLFYNKVSKEKLFVIEVDGTRYHEKNKKQSVHDAIKDTILRDNQIAIYRFKTNESKQTQRLKEILDRFTH